ncbi:CRISPR-associated protein Csh2 [Arcticibacter pallidicorallinus]|uniref:CRISPR-associated protein Csh2 n=1 Tax=Arcticibacter pallidicorallinus TaxID=1259464 RepID=A0A2T0TT09_9SPHI|nr:type I CRISPR-associated protein Cas7 [Arcticibacter pallidicorallinus]PRY48842.1 CRISPR-associated protein Csh2 [Arcticibacter pallidicorallinus]
MSNPFNNRVFGCVIVKAINANYNADFTHQPRTLSDGTVYATDKALKYTVRNYLVKQYPSEKVFYFKSISDEMQPRSLKETYVKNFGEFPKVDKKEPVKARKIVLENLLKCIDVRLFGGTFAEEGANLSLHGTVQFTHGVNKFVENVIYSEQISSPFRNSNEKSTDSMQTTLGTQFKLKEGHYVHHLSVNPRNLEDMNKAVGNEGLTNDDISKLKEALRNGATFYDSSSKAGVENELLLWVELNKGSKLVLPSFVDLISVNENKEVDLSKIAAILSKENIKKEIKTIEIYLNEAATSVINRPEGSIIFDLN